MERENGGRTNLQRRALAGIVPYERHIGFYLDLGGGLSRAPTLRDSVRVAGDVDADRVLHYLEHAPVLAVTLQLVDDVLAGEGEGSFIEPLVIHTDGTWDWRSDIAYYYCKYHVRLRDEFLWHIRYRLWTPPTPTEIGLPEWCASETAGEVRNFIHQ